MIKLIEIRGKVKKKFTSHSATLLTDDFAYRLTSWKKSFLIHKSCDKTRSDMWMVPPSPTNS